MKYPILTLLLVCCICFGSAAQIQSWTWSGTEGSFSHEHGRKISTIWGDAYVIGSFSSDTLIIGNDTLLNHGSGTTDVYVALYNYLGVPVWAISFGGADMDEGLDIAAQTLPYGVYITGSYSSDSLVAGNTTLINSDTATREMFVMRIDELGNIIWARDMGGIDAEEGRSLKADPLGNVYITGGFRSSVIFGGDTLAPLGTGDVFIAKYDTAGNEIWMRSAGGAGYQEGNGIDVDDWGNVYITGMFYSDTISFDSNMLVNYGGGDGFIARYDTAGNAIWARSVGGAMFDESNAIVADMYGTVFVTGAFKSTTAIFGTDELANFDATNSRDMFVANYDSAGTELWAEAAAGTGDETGFDLALDAYFNYALYVIGTTESATMNFGWNSLVTMGSSDAFVIEYHSGGGTSWSTVVGGSGADYGLGIASGNNWFSFHCTGGSESPLVNFDTASYSGAGGSDIFVGRYDFPSSVRDLHKPAEGQVKIYPNPAQDAFTVALPGNARHLQIINVAGQVILSEDVAGRSTANYQLQHSGLYFVIVNTPTGKIAAKVLVE